MKRINILIIICLFSGLAELTVAQTILGKEAAVTRALENNLGIKLVEHAANVAEANTSKFNTGKLPTVALNGAYSFRLDNTTANFQDGRSTSLSFAPSRAANATLSAGYVLYDGFVRKYNTQLLQERFALSELEVEATMENIAAQTLVQYYQIASLHENLAVIKEAIDISSRRLNRAEQQLEFGQGTGLAVLNAQVDLNNDSLSFINTEVQLNNAKRALNNIMVDRSSTNYTVESQADFIDGLSEDALRAEMLEANLAISQLDKNMELAGLSVNIADARKLPTLSSSLSYGYSHNNNNSASFLASLNNNGLTAGLSLSWNIFDGGATRHAADQARMNQIGLKLQKDELIESLHFDFNNAWANYQNTLIVYETQVKNTAITRTNFERSEERFKAGQINSVDFRQAQVNLLNAETAMTTAKFQVKIAEVELLLLSGRILE